MDDLKRATVIATSLWGGIYSPLLPVDDEISSARLDVLIRRTRVDVLLPLHDYEAFEKVIDRHPELRWPGAFSKGSELVQEGFHGREFRPIDMRIPLSHYWRTESRHSESPRALIPEWSEPGRDAFHHVLFGAFSQADDLPNFREAFRSATRAEQLNVDSEPIDRLVSRNTPIEFTGFGLHIEGPLDGIEEGGLVLVDPANLDHLILFWNLRARGASVIACPTDSIDEFAPYIKDHISHLLEAPRRSGWRVGNEGIVGVFFPHALDETVEQGYQHRGEVPDALRALIPQEVHLYLNELGHWEWDGPGFVYRPARTEGSTLFCLMEARPDDSLSIAAAIDAHPFNEADRNLTRYNRQQWVWSFRPYGAEFWEPSVTIRPPFLPDLNEWLARQMVLVDPFVLRVQPDGFDVIAHVSDSGLSIYALRTAALLNQLFQRAGLDLEVSEAGLRARRIRDMFGGLRYLEVFKIPGVRSLISKAANRKPIVLKQATEWIRDYDPGNGQSSFDQFRARWRYGSETVTEKAVFRNLLDRGVFRPALQVKCPHCRLYAAIDADLVRHQLSCPLCGKEFSLAIQLTAEAKWVYQLSGVFSRPAGEQGAIPSLLTMSALQTDALGDPSIMETAHIIRGDGIECETDFICIETDRDGFASVCIGECKDQGAISHSDIQNLARIRNAFRSSGVECFVAFATMRSSFTDEEVDMFREVSNAWAREYRIKPTRGSVEHASPPILLTSRELEADRFLDTPRQDLPHSHPMSLLDVAENSQVAYLGDRIIPGPWNQSTSRESA